MIRRFFLTPALLAAAVCAFPQAPPERAVFTQIEEILAELGRITGMKAPKTVAADVIDKKGLKQFLEQRIRETVKPSEIRAEEATLKKFGLVPQDFDLQRVTVDLLTEQAAAFYDYRKKKLFLMDATPTGGERPLLVHELAHAVADHNFNLQKYILHDDNDDGSLARQAVMEGQATWLMAESLARRLGQSLKNSPDMLDAMDGAGGSGGMFPVFDKVPLYLRESLLFSYTKGVRFQQALYLKMGPAGFAEVFRRPPVSTQQILHPEKYLAGVVPTHPALPKARLRGYRELAAGTVGEFDHAVLFRQYAGESEGAALAPLWRGGRYRLLEDRKASRSVLLYVSEWEGEDAARRAYNAYRITLTGKWKKIEVSRDSGDSVYGRGDDGHFVLSRAGARISSIEGLAGPPKP